MDVAYQPSLKHAISGAFSRKNKKNLLNQDLVLEYKKRNVMRLTQEMAEGKPEEHKRNWVEYDLSPKLPQLPDEKIPKLYSAENKYIAYTNFKWMDITTEDPQAAIDCLFLIKVLDDGELVLYQAQAQPALSNIAELTQELVRLGLAQFRVNVVKTLRTNTIRRENFSSPRVEIPNPTES